MQILFGSAIIPYQCFQNTEESLLWFLAIVFPKMPVQNDTAGQNNGLTGVVCSLCEDGFAAEERMVNSNGQILHERCFM